MVVCKDRKEMRLEQVKQVVEVHKDRVANRLLKETKGWILLDLGVCQYGRKESGMKGGVCYVFGRKKAV